MSRRRILLAHGAGLPSSSPWMQGWSERLATLGEVTSFDYPYMAEGRKRPDRLPKLIAAHTAALDAVRAAGDGPIILAGKSMGSRVGCHVANAQHEAGTPVAAVVCFGYPLASMGNRDKLRDEVLLALRTPVLFVQGTRDRLCPLDLLAEVRARMTAPSVLHVVEAGDHSLRITKTRMKTEGITPDDVDDGILAAVRTFLEEQA
jgi:predicted alpha/beta-hydrolase family hydrolase